MLICVSTELGMCFLYTKTRGGFQLTYVTSDMVRWPASSSSSSWRKSEGGLSKSLNSNCTGT